MRLSTVPRGIVGRRAAPWRFRAAATAIEVDEESWTILAALAKMTAELGRVRTRRKGVREEEGAPRRMASRLSSKSNCSTSIRPVTGLRLSGTPLKRGEIVEP